MPTEQLLVIVVSSLFASGLGALITVGALNVHIVYLREGLRRNEKAIERAHERITSIKKIEV